MAVNHHDYLNKIYVGDIYECLEDFENFNRNKLYRFSWHSNSKSRHIHYKTVWTFICLKTNRSISTADVLNIYKKMRKVEINDFMLTLYADKDKAI